MGRRKNQRVFGDQVRCSRCKSIKHKSMFYPSKSTSDGLSKWCKECNSEVSKERYWKKKGGKDTREKFPRKQEGGLRCSTCGFVKPYTEFHKNTSRPDGYGGECKYCTDVVRFENPSRRMQIYKDAASRRDIEFHLTIEEFISLTSLPCHYCGLYSRNKDYCGIDRVDSDGHYVLSNCVSCCDVCNRMKLDYTQEFFLSHIHRIYRNNPT